MHLIPRANQDEYFGRIVREAIRNRQMINFYYSGDGQPGFRTVEPHMVAYNKAGKLALSAWFLSGASESQTGQWWREYIVDDISSLTATSQQFAGPRPGFKRDGGKIYLNVVCSL
jgi:predicted DNA-binding transcriptional regulator YafY